MNGDASTGLPTGYLLGQEPDVGRPGQPTDRGHHRHGQLAGQEAPIPKGPAPISVLVADKKADQQQRTYQNPDERPPDIAGDPRVPKKQQRTDGRPANHEGKAQRRPLGGSYRLRHLTPSSGGSWG